MTMALVLSGGVAHDFPALAAELTAVLAESSVTADVHEDVEAALARCADYELLVVNMLRWRMDSGRYLAERDRWGISLSAAARAATTEFVRGGGGMLALHAASICFDDWPEWTSLVGGRWVWGTSTHPPFGSFEVTVHPDRHDIVANSPTSFVTEDEAYGFLELADDVLPLATAAHGGATHPLIWARTVGRGRVVHDALGHAVEGYRVPAHREIVSRAIRWLLYPAGGAADAVPPAAS